MPAQRTDDDCTLWYCEQCQACGVITMEPGDCDVYGVVATVKRVHREQSPNCHAEPRVARPMSWYSDLFDRLYNL